MGTFDYENNNPVGYVDILPNGNANIDIVGYVDRLNKYHHLNSKEVSNTFPPKGRVFAHNFVQKYESFRNSLVCLAVMPNAKDGEGLDSYIWDKSVTVYEFGTKLKSLKANLNEDGENNFRIFQENDLIETESDKFILCGDKVYYIKAQSRERLIPYWNISSLDIIDTSFGKKYIPSSQLPEKDGCIDITNDDQLINWFMTKILRKHYSEIVAGESFDVVEQYLVKAFNDMKNLTPNVHKSRLERIKRISTNFIMTLDELHAISDIPWVKNVIQQTVEAHKQSLISDTSAEYKDLLDKLKEEHETQIELEKIRYEEKLKELETQFNASASTISENEAKATAKLEEKKLEIEILDETIATKKKDVENVEQLIKKANERKNDLISDFSIIKEVFGMGSPVSSPTLSKFSKTLNIESIDQVGTECMMYNAYKKSLEDTLKANKLPHQNASTIADMMAEYKLLLVPDGVYAMAIIHAAQKCYYGVEYVNVGWKSFDDLWTEGLQEMVQHCNNEPEQMHFLILQNINLSYLPNYMQPILDIQMGLSPCFPSGIQYPDNLRILCTLDDGEVLPMSEKSLSYIGCIEKPSKEIHVSSIKTAYDERYGYLSPSKLIEGIEGLSNVPNFYKSYIDE